MGSLYLSDIRSRSKNPLAAHFVVEQLKGRVRQTMSEGKCRREVRVPSGPVKHSKLTAIHRLTDTAVYSGSCSLSAVLRCSPRSCLCHRTSPTDSRPNPGPPFERPAGPGSASENKTEANATQLRSPPSQALTGWSLPRSSGIMIGSRPLGACWPRTRKKLKAKPPGTTCRRSASSPNLGRLQSIFGEIMGSLSNPPCNSGCASCRIRPQALPVLLALRAFGMACQFE